MARRTEEERYAIEQARYAAAAKRMHVIGNRIAAKKLRESLDKHSPIAGAIRALKGLLRAQVALEKSMLSEDNALAKAIGDASEKVNAAIRKETGVDVAKTFATRSGKDDDDDEPEHPSNDPTPPMFPEEPVVSVAASA